MAEGLKNVGRVGGVAQTWGKRKGKAHKGQIAEGKKESAFSHLLPTIPTLILLFAFCLFTFSFLEPSINIF
jgi:hypothetical protein